MKALVTLWKFSRPHTIIGSVISICTLYVMSCREIGHNIYFEHLPLLLLAIITGITCNIYIVGINQIEDVELDKINKPFLPLASGELSAESALRIVRISLFTSMAIGLYLSPYLFLVVSISMLIGWAYSCPPLYLRKHHLPAALAIAIVRGLMVNVGGYVIFNKLIGGEYAFTGDIQTLSIFIVAFTIVIAWFKDLPDMKGDAEFKIQSLAILYSPKFTILAGNFLVIAAYVYSIIYYGSKSGYSDIQKTGILFYGHIALVSIFVLNSIFSAKANQLELKKYYKRFWLFFFAEYLLYFFANLS